MRVPAFVGVFLLVLMLRVTNEQQQLTEDVVEETSECTDACPEQTKPDDQDPGSGNQVAEEQTICSQQNDPPTEDAPPTQNTATSPCSQKALSPKVGLTARQKRWVIGWLVALFLLFILICVGVIMFIRYRIKKRLENEQKDRKEGNKDPLRNKRPNAPLHALYSEEGLARFKTRFF